VAALLHERIRDGPGYASLRVRCGQNSVPAVAMGFRYHLVEEFWTHLGWFESEIPDWSVGQEIVDSLGRRFAITSIVANLDPDADLTATWTVEWA
jgi:hypothetical protein